MVDLIEFGDLVYGTDFTFTKLSFYAVAHKLKLRVIAEGIELSEHHYLLSTIDCDIGQGFLFSKPLPEPEFIALLESSYKTTLVSQY